MQKPLTSAPPPAATDGRRVWLRVGTLIDGTGSRPLRDAHLVYDSQSILHVGSADSPPPASALNPGQSDSPLDLSDYTVLPGLIEAHSHLFLEGSELDSGIRAAQLKQSPDLLLPAARYRAQRLLGFGVVAVRDAGDKFGVGLALKKIHRNGDGPFLPLVDSPGAAIHRRGRYGAFMAAPLEEHPSLLRCVEARVNAGADRIKLIATGALNFKHSAATVEPQLTAPEVSELVAAANLFGKQTFAHASGEAGIGHVIEGGVDSLEHGYFVQPDQLARMRDRQIAWVPTFAPVHKHLERITETGADSSAKHNLRRILDEHARNLLRAHELGVQIIAGSDAGSPGVPHGLGLILEMELMERAGLSPLAVIQAATGAGASRLAFREKCGQIRPGFRSRFILTRHSPVETVSNLLKERCLVYDGAVFETEQNPELTGL